MNAGKLAAITLGALLLAGCGGGGDTPPAAPTDPGSTPGSTATGGDAQAAGSIDCNAIDPTKMVQFIVWTQTFAQVRSVDGLQTMATLQYTPENMAAILDQLDGLKGVEGEVYGKPDDALVVMRTANDTYATIISKGDAATDADFAPLDALEPDVTGWIKAQGAITSALATACPDLDLSS